MKGEITLADALERVTKSVRERSDGLADLKHVLRHNQRSSSIETLSDASFHRIYETLFAIVVTEQTAHASAKTTTLKSAAANRLTSCAGVLRLAVEVGIVSVGIKTVKALLDHFIETTYLPNGDICEPLALEYPKAMRAILSHPPHVAHLPKLEWDRTAKFCLEHLSTAQSENHGESASLGAATTFLSSRSSRSRLNNSLGSQPARGSSKQVTEEMAACLRLLTSAPNAPVTAMATEILWATIGFLQVNTATNLAHQDAFGILGNVLSWTKTEDIRLTRATTGQLVRLIRTYWGVRASGLKEMMIVFIHLQLYIKDQSLKVGSETLMADLHGLLEVLRSEYSKRQERDQLRLDDVRFGCEETARRQPGSLHSGVISLQCVGVRAEQSWTSVHMMAFIASVLYHNQAKANENDDDEEDEDDDHRRARKRQRTSDELDDLLSLATGGTTGSRITALQTLSFLLQRTAIPTAQLSKILAKSLLLSNDEHTTIASWSMIIVASCAYQLNSTDASLAAHWTSLWQLVCRSMTSAGTCRAACAVLCMILRIKLVPGSLVSELFQSLTVAFELSGPNILCDTALEFMRLTMVHAISTLPSSALVLGNSMIGWLLRRWLPSKFDDRSYASSCNLFNNADVVCTVSQYLGQSSHFGAPSGFPTWDVLGRSWIIAQKHDRLISYLLSLTQEQNHTHQATLSVSQDAATASIPKPSSEALIVNHLTNELARTAETWKQMVHDRPQGISLDIFSALCHFLSVSACFSYCTHFSNSRQQSQLQQHCRSLFKTTNVYVKNKTCGQDKVDNMLVCFSQNLWRSVNDDTTDDIGNPSTDCRHEICAAMTDAIASRTASQFIDDEADVEDMMDIGDSYESQESRRDRTQAGAVELVDDASITYSVHALRAAIPLYASIITTVTGSASHSRESDGVSTVVDDIVALPESSILASRVVLTRLPALVPDMTANDFETLLGHLTETFLESYTFERSEAAIGTVLDAMIGFKSFWVDTSNQSLAGLGLDTYEWCVSTALKAGILSPNVQKRISTLLLELCEVNTQYPQDDNVPSVRTSLFALLRRGAIAVQFHLAERISTIFGLFVLSAHEAMFNDLQSSLPVESEWTEGLAMRLLFLAKLASSWQSLLRQSVYYIFETAGRVDTSKPYAVACVGDVAVSLGFQSPRKLFRLFAPQLLHTWLENQPLSDLPYDTFGFDNLQDLLIDNQSEVVAQLLMRGSDSGMQLMADTLEIEVKELLKHAFGKSVAYAISRDIVRPSSEHSSGCETRLRSIINSKEEYRQLSAEHFATIMGHFFLCMNQDDVEDGWLEKRESYPAATDALRDIKGFSYSTRALPSPQQPSFRSRYLADQMERFCRRTSQDPTAPWESATFAVAARMMFDSLDSALGSLHNCTVLRKLRLLIATAGEIAVTGYPLELLLRGVQPYLTDSQCADDALGIMKYLMRRGRRQLSTNIKFMCGVLTTLLLEIREHMGTTHEKTTQETQHRETIQKMQNFYNFGVQYMKEFRQTVGPSWHEDYDALVNALSHLELPGNARKDSPESTLLLLLVRQDSKNESLFERGDATAALAILTRNFSAPLSVNEDALVEDAACVGMAPHLWRAISSASLDGKFVLWAGKAIGRSYAASGNYNAFTIVKKAQASLTQDDNLIGAQLPYASIVRRLCDMILSPGHSESGLAEYTLRSVALKLIEDSEEEGTYKAALPELLAPVIMRGTYGYTPSALPRFDTRLADRQTLKASLATNDVSTLSEWTTGIALVLCRWRTAPFLLTALPPMLLSFPRLAMDILPAMLHMILEIESEEKQDLRPELSAAISKHLDASAETLGPKQDYLLDFILYMRRQRYPKELTKLDRLRWLEIDYMHAASAATERGKPALALMLAETSAPPVQSSRRASSRTSSVQQLPIQIPDTMLLRIFEQVDEPDSFYGVEQPASLQSVLGRLDYEKAGFKSLMFRSAQVDSHMRQSGRLGDSDALGMVRSLSALNLSSLTYALTSGQAGLTTAAATDEMLDSARKLQQWDIALPDSNADGSSRLLTLYQDLRQATKMTTAVDALNALTLEHVRSAQSKYTSLRPPHPWFSSLGMIAETLELVSCSNQTELTSIWVRMQARNSWMENARFEDFDLIQQGRITTFSVLSRNESLLKDLHITRNTMRASEVQALLSHSALARQHGQLQTALCAATQVDDLAQDLRVSGIYVDVAAKHEVASVLWGSQENSASVKMLRDTINTSDFGMQEIKVGRSGLLAQLGKQLADARLEKPSDILEHYLRPAIKELPKNAVGKEAGEVYHTFAVFCDQQLQHPANVEDYKRIITLRQRKLEEVQQLEAMFKGTRRGTASREDEQSLRKAQQWFKLDDEEFRQQKASRETFVQQSLQNYLLALHASDEHNLSVLRFFALWLESSESKPANATVSTHLPNVPSWKFVVLLNQLMSRLQSDDSAFQTTLGTLMKRLCLQHPYHSVHHVYASSKASSSGDDATASRYNAAVSIRKYVSGNQAQGNLFKRLFTANSYYRQLAEEALHDRKQGKRALKDIKTAQQVARTIPSCQVPPVTMDIPLRPDGDYSDVPVVTRFGSTVSIMSGLSTPKVLTAHSSDGQQYRQLFKSGNDDLRQDAIMEQVFEEVSKMLQNHKATRQRNLHIRTYKVIPLSSRSGIIEFVPNSIPINEFLLPAHALYGPQDMKHNSARERIRNAQSHSTETRVKEFRKVCDNFQPVMRHFFLERFDDPDDWFEKRTAYTRTTASVSMLGHVLGLGDRHGHNIMLDEVTGEVVHIDLGVAFEAGRILPIPELVPFRLTRDIVDGMGVNKTEGVFRRCCEFTMDALREDKDSIMTLLNVLRYDPLYNWTLSPLRAKRMQDAQDSMHNAKDADAAEGSKAKMAQEGGEADRALAIVEKKLSSTLSTAATVNELIQQATDEKNLATLFVGWAAWF